MASPSTPRPAQKGPAKAADAPSGSAPPSSPSPSSPTQPPGPDQDDDQGFATEKPVIPPADAATSVYVVTVDNRTGIATRIERLDEQSGGRKEISPMEYVQLIAGYYAPAIGENNVVLQAYLQGMKDYFGALAKGA
jgi:hypothetical protein